MFYRLKKYLLEYNIKALAAKPDLSVSDVQTLENMVKYRKVLAKEARR